MSKCLLQQAVVGIVAVVAVNYDSFPDLFWFL